ncbi:hypothetical protein NHX12_022373 [Muraenolepis orangiensis]|uniref:Uncharacterized protein n=1 Tax=Muraenolepis orangiensis TaxID=630683 RepID=A0A9Q0ERG0_9TELE|nr:hypothetical protein NHX12_022373 [Muraenolepis orangiensis]
MKTKKNRDQSPSDSREMDGSYDQLTGCWLKTNGTMVCLWKEVALSCVQSWLLFHNVAVSTWEESQP